MQIHLFVFLRCKKHLHPFHRDILKNLMKLVKKFQREESKFYFCKDCGSLLKMNFLEKLQYKMLLLHKNSSFLSKRKLIMRTIKIQHCLWHGWHVEHFLREECLVPMVWMELWHACWLAHAGRPWNVIKSPMVIQYL